MGISDDTQVEYNRNFRENMCNFVAIFQVKISAQCLRERFTETTIDLGVANISIGELKSEGIHKNISNRFVSFF